MSVPHRNHGANRKTLYKEPWKPQHGHEFKTSLIRFEDVVNLTNLCWSLCTSNSQGLYIDKSQTSEWMDSYFIFHLYTSNLFEKQPSCWWRFPSKTIIIVPFLEGNPCPHLWQSPRLGSRRMVKTFVTFRTCHHQGLTKMFWESFATNDVWPTSWSFPTKKWWFCENSEGCRWFLPLQNWKMSIELEILLMAKKPAHTTTWNV